MKKLIDNTKVKIAKYLIAKITEYQNRQNGIKSETVNYLYNKNNNEFVLDISENIWKTTSDIELAKKFDRNIINNTILKLYNVNKPVEQQFKWQSYIKLNNFNISMNPMLQVNEQDNGNSNVEIKTEDSIKDYSLSELDDLGIDEI